LLSPKRRYAEFYVAKIPRTLIGGVVFGASRGFKMVLFTEASDNLCVGATCAPPSAFLVGRCSEHVSDVDECAYDPPICSQLCNNSASQFTCSCVAGYRLSDDLRHCVALPWKPGGPFLIYAQANGIYQVSVRHGTSALPSLVHRSRGHIFSLGRPILT